MSAIFLSYRRDDSSGYAGRLFDNLAKSFGRERVFMDIETLEPGMDFVSGIDRAIESCGAVIAMIGPNWINARDGDGNPRLDNPHDFIRLEITTALNRGVRVIPVLVHNASMPLEHELPEPLRPLCRLQAFEMSDNRWEFDVHRLAGVLDPLIAEPEQDPKTPTAPVGVSGAAMAPGRASGRRLGGWLAMLAVVAMVVGGGFWWIDQSTSTEQTPLQDQEPAPPSSTARSESAATQAAPPPGANPPHEAVVPTMPSPPHAVPQSETAVDTPPPHAAAQNEPVAPTVQPLPPATTQSITPVTTAPPPQTEPSRTTSAEPERVAAPLPPEPSPFERRQREIAELIDAAEVDIAELRLTRPTGNNAYERFRRVLELEPHNRAATEGLMAITERYRGLVEDALDRGALDDAQRHLASARAIDPGAVWLRPLQHEIDRRRQIAARPPTKPGPATGNGAQRASCLADCERGQQACHAAIMPQTETDCLSNSEIACEDRYRSCVSDTSKLFMGRVSLESECAGVHIQCSKAAARECSAAPQFAEQHCDAAFDRCTNDCPGL